MKGSEASGNSARQDEQANTRTVRLGRIAYARSGDKGTNANVGVIAYTSTGYKVLAERLSEAAVRHYFRSLGARDVRRYELPNLGALNFVLHGVLDGGSLALRVDAQGKALGQAILEMPIDVPETLVARCLPLGKGVTDERCAGSRQTPRAFGDDGGHESAGAP